ncbi:MAG: serine hydrolase domain-containing protein, partial [Cyanobacteria bacterium J06649_11]
MKTRLTFFLLLLGTALFAQDFDRAKMDQYLNVLEQHNKAMFGLAIMDDGKMVYQKSIGNANVEEAIQPNTDTQYRIGSITKVFTATLIFQLIEEGKLSLDTKLSTFYPEIKNADKITISHLLRHQSGIFNITNRLDFRSYMSKPQTKEEMLKRLASLDSTFEPGSKGSYSNSGFILLGYIVEELTGNSYANELQKRIIQPLGLKRTNYGSALATSENHAKSYRY